MRTSLKDNQILRNLLLMLAFGVLSQLLGKIRFFLPGMEGGGSDMREIAILLSVIYFPHWIYLLGVSFITSLTFPPGGIEVSTLLMHSIAGIFAWIFYTFIIKRIRNVYYLGVSWAGMVVLYYMIFLLPTMVIVFYAYGLIERTGLFLTYKKVLFGLMFELFAATAVTTLFIVLHRMAEVLELRNKDLQIALAKSEESDRLKSAFLANINHEIRTPLNGIMGFTGLLVDPDVSADLRETYGEIIISSSNRLLSIIDNIIYISQIEAGQAEAKNDQVSLNAMFDNIRMLYTPMAQDKQVHFQVIKTLGDDACTIITDQSKLLQVLDNLLDNAFKFIIQGTVTLGYVKDGERVRFYVEDTGQGIEADQLEIIFQRFTKVEVEKEKLYDGTGLGLAISKALIEILGGTMEVASEPGKGSVFSFTLPTTTF